MPRVIPTNPRQQLEFFTVHVPQWRDHSAELGLSREQLDSMADQVEAATAQLKHMLAQRSAAEAATQHFNSMMSALTNDGRLAVRQIKLEADAQNDPTIYETAQIPPPDTVNSKRPEPPMPRSLTITMRQAGQMYLTWRSPLRSDGNWDGATFFEISRSLIPLATGRLTPWTLIGTSSDRAFIDADIPAGTLIALYRVTAIRNGLRSDAAATQFALHSTGPKVTAERAAA